MTFWPCAMSLLWWLDRRYQASCLVLLSFSHVRMKAMPVGPATQPGARITEGQEAVAMLREASCMSRVRRQW